MLYVNPKYLQRSERNTFRDFTRYHFGGNVMARKSLTTASTRSLITLGVDDAYQDGAILFYTLSPTQDRGTTLTDNKGEGANNFGVFLQDELSVGDRLTLSLGARYDAVAYNYRSFLPNPPVSSDHRNFSRVSPKLGVSWLLNATHSVYANVGGGIEVPAGNETDPTPGAPPALLNPLLDPIRSTTYEVGLKSVPASASVRPFVLGYDVALYDIEVTNEIVPYNGGRYYLTAGKARRQGAEVGLNARSSSGLFGDGGAHVLEQHVHGLRRRFRGDLPDGSDEGREESRLQRQRGGGCAERAREHRDRHRGAGVSRAPAQGGVEHSGKYFADDANKVGVPSFTILNLTAELRDPILTVGDVGMRGFVTVKNVTNKPLHRLGVPEPRSRGRCAGGVRAGHATGGHRFVIVRSDGKGTGDWEPGTGRLGTGN